MSVQLPPYRPLRRRNGLKVMLAAIHALLMRELQTRFGGYRLGYLWAPLEVFLQVSVYLVIFGALMHRILPGMEYSIFLLSGIIPYTMFNRIVTRSMGAVEANRGLLMYRSVKHIDVIMARGFLELIIYFFSFWLLISGIIFFQDLSISLESLDTLLWGWLGLFLFSLGLALIIMVIGHFAGELTKIISIVFSLLYFLSGIMYSVHIIPQPYLDYLMYNPLIHVFESMRHALAPTYPAYHVDMNYFIKWMVAVDFIGLLLYKAFENDFIRSR
jgi:capsular polysaccharide transport system permease protein